jgi:hypothetical protein
VGSLEPAQVGRARDCLKLRNLSGPELLFRAAAGSLQVARAVAEKAANIGGTNYVWVVFLLRDAGVTALGGKGAGADGVADGDVSEPRKNRELSGRDGLVRTELCACPGGDKGCTELGVESEGVEVGKELRKVRESLWSRLFAVGGRKFASQMQPAKSGQEPFECSLDLFAELQRGRTVVRLMFHQCPVEHLGQELVCRGLPKDGVVPCCRAACWRELRVEEVTRFGCVVVEDGSSGGGSNEA